MKKVKEKDIRILEALCMVMAAAAAVLCILYLFDLLQNHWFENFIFGLGVLLHVSLSLLFLIRHKHLLMGLAAVFALFYAGCLVYFNV